MKRVTRNRKRKSILDFFDRRLDLTDGEKAARHARIVAAMPDPNISRTAKLTRARLMAGR